MTLTDKRILLIISGGIAAYKSLELIRRLRERGASVRPIMTRAAQEFITPLAVGALSASHVYTDLFSREDEQDVGHIRLARDCDLIVVAPVTADLMAKMAHGLADDLASAVLLAADRPVLIAPAMNPKMWAHPATLRNVAQLKADGIQFIGPMAGEMAESGEKGLGRMAEPLEIVAKVEACLDDSFKPLAGKKAIVTSGPTHEPIDPVRYIANRSSGKQGHAIAGALAQLGAEVTLVSGPVSLADPTGVKTIHVERAEDMRDAVLAHLPADIAVMVAAVADWRVEMASDQKIKKQPGDAAPMLTLTENPDILKTVGHHEKRPALVVGFAAETQNVEDNGRAKLERKGADLIVANDVSPQTGIMGGDRNRVTLIYKDRTEDWPDMDKDAVADRLAQTIAGMLGVKSL
ncbi:bifunctional phosphopantothenoylcysteine decarboxylase/phosphopantothenate--cysteine ligase CoaBC [Agrobacterium vitis]|uniref:bifunctional phosphopantothenoylcysteine decarboxylase/phosphopantothenate--cysteine ligase CoaBC n=1 Tax=Rhizobium/Agrobacterium group TaxID=227290 RepID=UPI0008DC1985|nr:MULTISPECIES: bifunctional phosphopantothenoylcysteine decarboxylase/phosphopantothenate--cysteine ligase CoaBC [Rhizobium/Agrobacterium group]MCF1435594.1 bifunctional phosphopantothenoylcysteine decarboxylase/phosphopantothenate--cysteine ligase CoaBC [Allorhizobium ampelinum]MUO88634.1 bifunctional phosphopantothenoylcysteine decarboxylase/phosphopantothenate--cysteine ligase CoaBC [Agrobacterium vitis]MUZ52203.1 bifunctional phosphopantothenoylcysteine decarboxylase/phosphopantothenate--c